MTLVSIDPTTGETIHTYDEASPARVAAALEQARRAWAAWKETTFPERARVLDEAARLLEADADALARLMAAEMGKPLAQGIAEIEKCAAACRYSATTAEAHLAADATEAGRSSVVFEPLGVVLAVMPWNFPFWQVFRFAAPALAAGNAAVLKHASNVTGCALAIEALLSRSGLPDGLFRALLIGSSRVREAIEHPAVAAVTLTGSTPAGSAVAGQAGAAIKKTVLELGGSDPYLVLEDADLERAAAACVASRLVNGGQSCIAAKRFVVIRSVLADFTERFVGLMRGKRVGHPLEEGTDVGPQARHDLRDAVHAQVVGSVARGARLLLGGEVPPGPGAYYPPTVLAGVTKGMPAFDEEVFGPVAAIVEASDEEHAVALANDSPFGLGAAVFTRDLDRGERLARRLAAGSVFVNAAVASDPRFPFGGIKASGYGRELGSYGIKEFVNVKTVRVER